MGRYDALFEPLQGVFAQHFALFFKDHAPTQYNVAAAAIELDDFEIVGN